MRGMTHYTDNLSQLGAQTAAPTSPETAVLERVPNPHADTLYLARFTAPEFTSLCPVTGQPDFAHIVIDYAPDEWLVESKSLKLYLTSFRNHGAFHEDCTVAIGRRLAGFLAPKWLRIGGDWYPRGGGGGGGGGGGCVRPPPLFPHSRGGWGAPSPVGLRPPPSPARGEGMNH